jgi:class 3 adenylate cyclase
MEPRIQYCKTKDGVSIAYWTLGEGMPLVVVPHPAVSHIQSEWRFPAASIYYERLAEERMVVCYDGRGTGLSDRDLTDFSLDTFMLDLEAVVDHLGLKTFALFGRTDGGPVAMAYAASHPERVSHLVLWCSFARGSDLRGTPEAEADLALVEKDWEIYTETMARMMLGWSAGQEGQRLAAFLRESVAEETFRAIQDVLWELDVTSLLPQVRAPTLVLPHRQGMYGVKPSRVLASGIPDAYLVVLEGRSQVPYLGDSGAVLQAIDEFLGEGAEAKAASGLAAEDIHTILFTDVEGSTALTQRLGDAKARELLREHERMVREALKSHGGAEVKTLGDGFMASFSSASKALECAIAMQQAFDEWNEGSLRSKGSPSTGSGRTVGEGSGRVEVIRVRIGLNAGEPIAEDDPDGRSDLFGTAVNEAARITAAAKGGEILVSNVVRELAKGKGFLFADRGEANLKGFDEPVRLYEVRWREEG